MRKILEKLGKFKKKEKIFAAIFLGLTFSAPASEEFWYMSNAAGFALAPAPSRIAALRSDYCLVMKIISENESPPAIKPYYQSAFRVDCRTLYEKGKPKRRQWIFRDEKGRARLASVAVLIESAEEKLAFIERYDENGVLLEEKTFSDSEESLTLYFYKDRILEKTETRVKTLMEKIEKAEKTEELENEGAEQEKKEKKSEKKWEETKFWTDYYEYSRSASLRAVKRTIHLSPEGESPARTLRISFPQIKPNMGFDKDFVRPSTSSYEPEFVTENLKSAADAVYETDTRGYVLTEKQYDDAGVLLSELTNTWARDRLASAETRSFDKGGAVLEKRRVEYDYDEKGKRVMERDYVNGTLERTVKDEGDQEIEELYIGGKIVLRAIWENGRKIKEERVK